MNKKQIIGAVVAAVLFITTGVTSVLTNTIADSFLKEIPVKFCQVEQNYNFRTESM